MENHRFILGHNRSQEVCWSTAKRANLYCFSDIDLGSLVSNRVTFVYQQMLSFRLYMLMAMIVWQRLYMLNTVVLPCLIIKRIFVMHKIHFCFVVIVGRPKGV